MSAMSPRERRLAAFVLVGTSLAGLVLCEGGLRLYSRVRGSKARDLSVLRYVNTRIPSDPKLWYSPPVNGPGHDAWGFRNARVPDRAEIVALGDSQTWGYNSTAAQSWPAILSKLSSRTVYNMALSGYGPVQYWALLPKALLLRPKVVVVGFYFGNDFYDAYRLAYRSDAYRSLRDPALEEELKKDAGGERWGQLQEESDQFERKIWSSRLNEWLTSHVETVRVLTDAGLWPDRAYAISSAYAAAHPEHAVSFPDGPLRTTFNFAIRLLTLEPNEPRVREGTRITGEVFARMQADASAAPSHLLVALIPTKEAAYEEVMSRRGVVSAGYTQQVQCENAARLELESSLAARGVAVLDLRPALQAELREGRSLYLEGGDGHPTAAGYRVIAAAVQADLARRGW